MVLQASLTNAELTESAITAAIIHTKVDDNRAGSTVHHKAFELLKAESFEKYEQSHVFKHVKSNTLSETEIDSLVKDLESLDLDRIKGIYHASINAKPPAMGKMEPLDHATSLSGASNDKVDKWRSTGLQAIAAGKVAALILAGGQGTRLGFAGPKGAYSIGLPSGKSLFQLFAERIVKLQQLAAVHGTVKIPLCVMTSVMNHEETKEFFAKANYFGLEESQVIFFPQGTLPCLTEEGKIIMESAGKVARASDGNGGIYTALESSGTLDSLEKSGVEYIHIFSVDNAMGRPVDPVFMGYCLDEGADCGNKVVWKNDPAESVGVVAKRDGKYCVIEYSEMDAATCEKVNEDDGKLLFGAGNICNHFYSVEFLRKILNQGELEFHIARKKIPFAGEDGLTIKPEKVNGIKLEAFIFDVFPLSEKMAVLDVPREDEFSPVKNAPGSPTDSPDSALLMLSGQARRWLEAAGGDFTSHLMTTGEVEKWGRSGLKRWKSRFFVFDAYTNNFSYYKDKTAWEDAKDCNASGTIVSFTHDKLSVECKTASGRVLKIRVDSEEKLQMWIKALTDALSAESKVSRLCEVSPLVSYAGESIENLKGKKFTLPFHMTASVKRRVSSRTDLNSFINSSSMQSAWFEKAGQPQSSLKVNHDQPTPELGGPSSILVEGIFATVNPIDIETLLGKRAPPSTFPVTLGHEMVGTVVSVGNNVSNIKAGDRVLGITDCGGCFAELVNLDSSAVCVVPDGLDLSLASSIPYSGLLAWQCLHDLAKISTEDKVLIIAGKGGVASIASQLAVLHGAAVVCVLSPKDSVGEYANLAGVSVVVDEADAINHFRGEKASVVCDFSGSASQFQSTAVTGSTRYVATSKQTGTLYGGDISIGSETSTVLEKIASLVNERAIRISKGKEISFEELSSAFQSLINGTQDTKFLLRLRKSVVSDELRAKFVAANQDHLFKFYDSGALSSEEVDTLVSQLERIDLSTALSDFKKAMSASSSEMLESLEPLDKVQNLEDSSENDKNAWTQLAFESISKGEVAALVLSGGQGTRLGFAGPKGMYDIGLPSGKSLFHLFAQRLRKLEELSNDKCGTSSACIPWYIMTSQMNDTETRDYFRTNSFFGLKASQVYFFPQGMLPCFTPHGDLMLESKGKVAMASDGNGGIYAALRVSGAITNMKSRGVKFIHAFSVDNALCKVADPVFIGYCIKQKADCGNKVLWKNSPSEKVGILAKRNGKYCVAEYSEMDEATCEKVNPKTGMLLFGAANICQHFYSFDFLESITSPDMSLKHHVAHKKIPVAAADGKTMKVTSNNGVKLETFIFDVFGLSKNMAVLSVSRDEEFAPVKNAPGWDSDSPDTARAMISNEAKNWIKKAGGSFVSNDGDDTSLAEISPLVSYRGEGLEKVMDLSKSIDTMKKPFQLYSENEVYPVPKKLREQFESAGQGHVFKFIDSKTSSISESKALIEQLEALDLEKLKSIFNASMSPVDKQLGELEPLDSFDSLEDASVSEKSDWYRAGLDAIAKGKVAAVLLGGGQGTRLGFSGPKGMYDIGLPSKKSLFELFALRLRRLCALAEKEFGLKEINIPWYVMTSKMNHEETREYFKKNSLFGLRDVFFFPQGTLPCMTTGGKLILESRSSIAQASDGNGGIYPAMQDSGALKDMTDRKVEFVHVFAVDNALCKVADPTFIGYCINKDADCGNKVVWKSNPMEKVGVVAKRGGKSCVVDYGEMDDVSKEKTCKDTGKLIYGAGNVCMHFYTVAFLKDVVIPSLSPIFHVAHKKIPHADCKGNTVKPVANNGIKLESFIFDVFPLSKSMAVLSVPRDSEFSPVKNAPGSDVDSPDTARKMISSLAQKWVNDAGGVIEEGNEDALCEVLPTVSYGGEDLESLVKNKSFKRPFFLESDSTHEKKSSTEPHEDSSVLPRPAVEQEKVHKK